MGAKELLALNSFSCTDEVPDQNKTCPHTSRHHVSSPLPTRQHHQILGCSLLGIFLLKRMSIMCYNESLACTTLPAFSAAETAWERGYITCTYSGVCLTSLHMHVQPLSLYQPLICIMVSHKGNGNLYGRIITRRYTSVHGFCFF